MASGSFGMLAVVSSTLLLQAAVDCNDKCGANVVWAVICSALSLVVCLAVIFGKIEPEKYLTTFMLVWWMAGAGVLTFDGPYTNTQNGYFASWLGLFVIGHYFSSTVSRVSVPGSLYVGLLSLGSIVVLVASSVKCKGGCEKDSYLILAIAISAVSTALCLYVLFVSTTGRSVHAKLMSLFLFVLWVAGWLFITVVKEGAFTETSNGFFGTWMALLAAGGFASEVFGKRK